MLTGRQIEQAQNALLEAFPSRDALRMLARIELDENLDAIAGGDNLRVIAFNLVSWAEQTGVFACLVDGAVRQNDGNTTLRELQRAVRAWTGSAPAGAATRKHGTRPQATIDIFLSYSRHDRTPMFAVHDILRGAGFSVWIDDGIEPGTAIWEDAIEEALHQAQAMVVLLSPNAKASPWVKREITYAMAQEKAVFPLLIAGDKRTSVPLSLITTQWVDARTELARSLEENLLPSLSVYVNKQAKRVGSSESRPQTGQTFKTRLKRHDRVQHSTFGIGTVVESKQTSEGDEVVTVAFPEIGIKKLLVSVANLKLMPKSTAKVTSPRFKRRDEVQHATFGIGTVIESQLTPDGDEQVTIAFPNIGIKKLIVSLADLIKL